MSLLSYLFYNILSTSTAGRVLLVYNKQGPFATSPSHDLGAHNIALSYFA